MIRARAALVEARTKLVDSARGVTKSFGEQLASCDPDQIRVFAEDHDRLTRQPCDASWFLICCRSNSRSWVAFSDTGASCSDNPASWLNAASFTCPFSLMSAFVAKAYR